MQTDLKELQRRAFLGTARRVAFAARARLVPGGGKTQVRDATVTDESNRTIAVFRCTQMVLISADNLTRGGA